ncbi:alpha/beta hydrolase [Nocardia implantans]|uniref:Alpha/beta hydrolase n=1 Tax=Nocardia implantans TaxID=3108168 RepID=A0ABU6B487_9NOCA|nr:MULTISPECIES: alpha/beta hydrolase [unclassified Nocardia]MBF6196256.1 alpha/beta hydrolase [Nocardia beijingensis]MEA3527780.1 alpha/beta hydrolase [Nocardia sp. CDC192]MEB3514514.1 alpha/beta hydrolase [Nocardia sp. CDC186]
MPTDPARTLVFATRPEGPLLLDLYRPRHGASRLPHPVVVWVHGGGWFTGDRTLLPDPRPLLRRGIAVASIEYRLSGTALFPAQLHDVRDAIRFLRTGAADLSVDPRRIGVWGASAGGHLAVLAGLTGGIDALPGEENTGDSSVLAVADAYGPATLVPGVVPDGAQWSDRWPPEWRLIGGDPADLPDRARAASPLSVLSDLPAGAALPTFQIAHGTADRLVPDEHSRRLHAALGARSQLYLVDGYRHGFLNPPDRPDVPAGMDDGRLARERTAAAAHLTGGTTQTTTFGLDTIADFFAVTLTGEPA